MVTEKKRLADRKLLWVKAIAERVVGMQIRIAQLLGRWERRCSDIQKKILFLLFVTVGLAYCAFILINAWWGHGSVTGTFMDVGTPHQGYPMPFVDSLENRSEIEIK